MGGLNDQWLLMGNAGTLPRLVGGLQDQWLVVPIAENFPWIVGRLQDQRIIMRIALPLFLTNHKVDFIQKTIIIDVFKS